jgi:hypothetical protein
MEAPWSGIHPRRHPGSHVADAPARPPSMHAEEGGAGEGGRGVPDEQQRQRPPTIYYENDEVVDEGESTAEQELQNSHGTGRLWLDAEYVKQTIQIYGSEEEGGVERKRAKAAARSGNSRIRSDFSELNTPSSITE